MCDQDHFEDDRQQYEARGLVTRKQFGKILGDGRGDDAAAGRKRGCRDRSRSQRNYARWLGRLLLRASGEWLRSRRSDVAGHLRAASGVSPDG